MLLTIHQKHIIDILAEIPYIRRNQLLWLMQMRFDTNERQPELIKGEPPCKLSFYLRDARGYLDFKVVPVPEGEEQMILSALQMRYQGFSCTYLFLLQREEQIERLWTENSAYYLLPNGKGGILFLKKQN